MSNNCNQYVIKHLIVEILKEADRDLEFFMHTKSRLSRYYQLDEQETIDCAVRIIIDLVKNGFCSLAQGSHPYALVQKTEEELRQLDFDNDCGTFLISTKKGADWVRRYENLVEELTVGDAA